MIRPTTARNRVSASGEVMSTVQHVRTRAADFEAHDLAATVRQFGRHQRGQFFRRIETEDALAPGQQRRNQCCGFVRAAAADHHGMRGPAPAGIDHQRSATALSPGRAVLRIERDAGSRAKVHAIGFAHHHTANVLIGDRREQRLHNGQRHVIGMAVVVGVAALSPAALPKREAQAPHLAEHDKAHVNHSRHGRDDGRGNQVQTFRQ
jgi:hypothetical protein